MEDNEISIQFYHLLKTPLRRALPSLMEKAVAGGIKTKILVNNDSLEMVSKSLWEENPESFLPHGNKESKHPQWQPIYLTDEIAENPNNAELLVIVNGYSYRPDDPPYKRVFDIFDGTDQEQLAAARKRWVEYKERGLKLVYIRQNDRAGWDKLKEV